MAAFSKRIRNHPREFEPLNHEIARFLEEHDVAAGVAYAVHLIVEELLLNVMKYAYGDDSERIIDLEISLSGGNAIVDFRDDGTPFDPRSAPVPDFESIRREHKIGGLGLHLVRSMAESVEYEYAGGKNHVRVHITPNSATK